MKTHHELTAAMLLNAYNTALLYYAIKKKPEPETLLDSQLEAWRHLVTCLDAETNEAEQS